MSTHPHSDQDDLDRTDELPVLDVVAYEAQLAAQGDTLASTDTWSVAGLREAEDLEYEDNVTVRFPRRRTAAPEVPKTSDVTVEATRILERIHELELELAGARVRERELQEHVDLLTNEIAAREQQMQALRADNERLAEQRSIVVERVHTLERQLQDDTAQFERDRLQMKELLADEERNAAQLARHLAAKIAEHENAGQELARRDAVIQALTAARDDLAALLDEARSSNAAIESQHADRIRDLERELEEREGRHGVLTSELEAANAKLQQLESDLAERDRALNVAHELTADLRRINAELEHKLQDAESRLEALAARDESLEHLRAELQLSRDEHAIMAGQLEKSRARSKAMAREIFARDNQIASLKADLAVHVEALAAINQDVSRTGTPAASETPERVLEPVGHDGEVIVLDRKVMTIGRTSDNDICVSSKLVSRSHARLLIGPNAVIIEDAGSTNGCLVNNVPVKQQLMRDGDVLAIGDLKFRLRTRTDTATRASDNVIPFGA